MDTAIYNIPARMVKAYRGRRLIVRAHHPFEFVQHLLPRDLSDVYYVQLLELKVEVEALLRWGENIPIDIVMQEPLAQFPLLYNFSKLQEKHPVRVTIPVRRGFLKAVKLALALKFAVKLDIGQPDAELIEELAEVLDFYLHRSTVAEPVEFFHSLFLSFYNQEPASLWFIQEEDPDEFCFVTDEGAEVRSRRLAGAMLEAERETLALEQPETLEIVKSECDDCAFFDRCRGYFKLPDSNYSCAGVKVLFGTLQESSEKMRSDLASHAELQKGVSV
jgi:hypothetical protein